MKCPYCGKDIVVGARQCGSCGNYIGESFGGGAGPTRESMEKAASGGRKFFVVAAVVLVLLGVAMAAFVMWGEVDLLYRRYLP